MMNLQAARYSDGGDDGLQDVEDYTSDYYDNQPGDVISNSTNHRRARRKSKCTMTILMIGALMVVGGIGFAMIGNRESEESRASNNSNINDSNEDSDANDSDNQSPSVAASPTLSPTAGSNEGLPTMAPTHESVEAFITSLVGEAAIQDPNSLAFRALAWLEQTNDAESYGKDRLQQRFALACLHLSTNEQSQWLRKDGWMTGTDECNWYGAECNNERLIALNLTENGLEGSVPSEIGFLGPTLLSLELANNDLVNEGTDLAWIGELTNLRLLDVESTSFAYDGIPPYISNLKELKILDVADTLFIGSLEGSTFAPLTNLIYLEIGGNFYNSTVPDEIANLPNLEAFYAYENGLVGDLEFLPKLDTLVEVWLDENPEIKGTIPTQISSLTNLASFSVTNCDLWGQIPTEFGNLMQLQQAWFYSNWFSGTIPSEFSSLPILKILGLEDNNITDTMPPDLCDMGMLALNADCGVDEPLVDCSCCTCCVAPCPVVNLPPFSGSNRLLSDVYDEIRRL